MGIGNIPLIGGLLEINNWINFSNLVYGGDNVQMRMIFGHSMSQELEGGVL